MNSIHSSYTDSYDEMLRCWDTRNPKRPLYSAAMGGGVWRIKQKGNLLALACMNAGFHLVGDDIDGEKKVSYEEHDSLAYGVDWKLGSSTIASCSFYDHLLRIWRPDAEALL